MSGYFKGALVDPTKHTAKYFDFGVGSEKYFDSDDLDKELFADFNKNSIIIFVVDDKNFYTKCGEWCFGIPEFIKASKKILGFTPKYEVIEYVESDNENDDPYDITLNKYLKDNFNIINKYDFSVLTKRLQAINFAKDMPDPGTIVRYKNGKWLSLDDNEKPVLSNYPDEFVNEEYAREAAKEYDPNMRNWSFETATRYFSYKRNKK